jgi:hypothetical protein
MNRYNDWQGLLKMANEDLDKFGYSLLIVEPEEGFYNCEIRKDGNLVETYAENYYEDELSDLITDAWHDIKLKLV